LNPASRAAQSFFLRHHRQRSELAGPLLYRSAFCSKKRTVSSFDKGQDLGNVLNRAILPALNRCAICGRQKDECGKPKKGLHSTPDHSFQRDTSRPEWHGWHAGRRGLGTNLYRLGVPEETIQAILRHANVSTTNTYYIKSAADDTRVAMAKLESLVIGNESAAQSFVNDNNVATDAADTEAVVIQ
jgi:integrase-like protein